MNAFTEKARKKFSINRLIENFNQMQIPMPEITVPKGGFNIYVYIEERYSDDFCYLQECLYFWPIVHRFYTGTKPVKRVFISEISAATAGISLCYRENQITENDLFIFEKKAELFKTISTGLDLSKIDSFLDIQLDSEKYNGSEHLFTMFLQIEDFLGNLSNKVKLKFLCYDPY